MYPRIRREMDAGPLRSAEHTLGTTVIEEQYTLSYCYLDNIFAKINNAIPTQEYVPVSQCTAPDFNVYLTLTEKYYSVFRRSVSLRMKRRAVH
jgi:hypothetical protein